MLKSPKKTYKFNGNQNVEDYILNSLSNNHLHHAYLLSGIKGIGKATFAYRVSRYLLSGSKEDNLYISKSEKTSNLIIYFDNYINNLSNNTLNFYIKGVVKDKF